ncbi:hypothetical protein J3A83DRAFT_4194309 [Scleroderma citrinum]
MHKDPSSIILGRKGKNSKAGRPGRGGYNIDDKLNWDESELTQFKEVMHKCIDKHLDTMQCQTAQDPKALDKVVEEACRQFVVLEDYQDYWQVYDIIGLCLKYLSSQNRQKEKAKESTTELKERMQKCT